MERKVRVWGKREREREREREEERAMFLVESSISVRLRLTSFPLSFSFFLSFSLSLLRTLARLAMRKASSGSMEVLLIKARVRSEYVSNNRRWP